jgi:hypothetical protein
MIDMTMGSFMHVGYLSPQFSFKPILSKFLASVKTQGRSQPTAAHRTYGG